MTKYNNRAGKKFVNITKIKMSEGSISGMMGEWFFSKTKKVPEKKLDYLKTDSNSILSGTSDGLRVTLIGHSTVFIEIDGYRVLTDPVFTDNVSPVFFYSVKRFQEKTPISIENLPSIDVADAAVNRWWE